MMEIRIAEDLRERYKRCCDPDDEAYSAWEATLIEELSLAEQERDAAQLREKALRDALLKWQKKYHGDACYAGAYTSDHRRVNFDVCSLCVETNAALTPAAANAPAQAQEAASE